MNVSEKNKKHNSLMITEANDVADEFELIIPSSHSAVVPASGRKGRKNK